MAFTKPKINKIHADIKNVSIYLRTTKKWGKTTLFRDVILEKYGDPNCGFLVQCGKERGATLLDNLNTNEEPIRTYKDFVEMKKWLIEGKGTEHNIQIIAFDTGDELVPIFEKETIRQNNLSNPDKPCKTINAAMGGFQEGQRFTANELIKPYMDELRNAGFGIWVIAHTKFKTIKEKGGTDENGYQQLSSNMQSAYEAAFGDIFDVCLTGVIDRDLEEKTVTVAGKEKTKRYITSTVRKLYFRETPLIDAGGRFAAGAVPEYMVFDKDNMAADFIKVVEDGMEKSKTKYSAEKEVTTTKPKKEIKPVIVEEDPEDIEDKVIEENNDVHFDMDDDDTPEVDIESLKDEIRALFKNGTAEQKKAVKAIMDGQKIDNIEDVGTLTEMKAVFE